MVGRDRDLEKLRSAWADAQDGGPRLAVVSGEAGIGKSRLLREFERETGATAVLGQCVDFGTVAIPYAPLSGVLRDLIREFGQERIDAAAGGGAAALRTVADGTPADRTAVDRIDEAFTTVLEALSSERPLLVTVEDLHWADPATLDVLRFASRVARVGQLLIVLSYRDDELDRGHPLRGFLADVDRNSRVDRVPLARLTPREVRAQAHDLMGSVPTADDARRLAERSQGIPFFVEELLALGAGAPVPASLREVLLARYDALPPSARAVCRAVAAAGEQVAHPQLADVIELAEGELDVAAAAAVESGVLISDGAGYDFRHALVREAVGAQQLPGERVRTHTRFAMALAGAMDDPADRTARAVRIAHHWYQALDLERAFETALSAMRMSLDSFAYATAAQLGERVLELWDRVPDPATAAEQDLPTLMAATASAWRRAGEPSRALATVERALEVSDGGDSILRAQLLRDRGMLLENDARSSAVADLKAALELVPPGTASGLRAEILVELAAQYMVAGRGAEALDAAARAAEEAPPEASRTRSFAANVRGATLLHHGDIQGGLAAYDIGLDEAAGDIDALLRYYINLSDGLLMLGRHEESIELAERGLAMAATAGVERTSGAILAVNTVDPLYALGEWERADRLIDRSLDLDPPASFRAFLRRAKIRSTLWRGDVDGAMSLWREWSSSLAAVAAWQEQARAHQALDVSDLLYAAGDLDAAWEVAGQLVGDRRLGSAPQELPLAPTAARIIARRRRDSGDAGLHSDDEARLLDVLDRDVWPTTAFWRALAVAELGGDDHAGSDPRLWEEAQRAAAAPEIPVINELLVEFGLARSLVVAGDRAGAAATLESLKERAAGIGAGLVIAWADELTQSAGLGARRRGDASSSELTAREHQVLQLVAEGLTNAQIGERLFLSPKTVTVHVSAILRKLGASTRTEAVRLAGMLR